MLGRCIKTLHCYRQDDSDALRKQEVWSENQVRVPLVKFLYSTTNLNFLSKTVFLSLAQQYL